MPQAQITINAVIGSDVDLPINTLVQLNNNNIGGEVSYLWEILDQPTGPADVLSSPTIQNPTFTPKKEGTYLIRLTVNQGLPDEDIDTVVGSVLQLKTRKRVPAAGEQVEASTSRGWALDVNDELRFFHDAASDTGTVVGVNIDASPMAKGTVVRATGSQSIKTGLPGAEDVPGFTPAPATVAGNMNELLLVVEGDIDGSSPVPVGALGVFRYIGQIQSLALGAGAVGDTVFVSDAAVISVTPGTNLRAVGSIMSVSGANRDIWFSGTTGGEGAPIDRAYLVYGAPGTLINANRVDGLLATGAINNIPYTFRAGDVTTHALVAKRFSAVGGDPFQVHAETGVVLGKFSASGALVVTPDGTSTTAITGTGSAPNGIGLVGNGAGTGAGVSGTASGASNSSVGVEGVGDVSGAATTSDGVKGTGAGTAGRGVVGIGGCSGSGVEGTGGGSFGTGVKGTGGTVDGNGVAGVATGSASGVRGTASGDDNDSSGTVGVGNVSGSATSSNGVIGVGAGTDGHGVKGSGAGTGPGIKGTASGASNSSVGVEGVGNVVGSATTSDGVQGTGAGTAGRGVVGIGAGTGTGVEGDAQTSEGYGVDAIGKTNPTGSGRASLRIRPQAGTPATLDDGAMWIVGATLSVRLNGVTRTVNVT